MEKTLKVLWGVACLVGMVCALWLVFRPTPVVVVGSNGKIEQTAQTFGGTTGLDALSLASTLTVGTDATVGGNLTITGVSSTVGGYYVAGSLEGTAQNATNTLCTVQNTSGHPRLLAAVSVRYYGDSSAGATQLTVGTSTGSGVTSTSPLINTYVTKIANRSIISTTSSLMTAYASWEPGDWLVWKSANTSTHNGECEALWF